MTAIYKHLTITVDWFGPYTSVELAAERGLSGWALSSSRQAEKSAREATSAIRRHCKIVGHPIIYFRWRQVSDSRSQDLAG